MLKTLCDTVTHPMQLFMVELAVADWVASVAWYRDRLGLRVALRDEANQFALLEAAGGGRIALKAGTQQPSGVTVHFQVADLSAEMTRLGITSEPKTSPEGYRRAIVPDPDGYAIVLFEWVSPFPESG